MIDNFGQIWWEDSWLLGWEKTEDALILFVELHLLRDHPRFEPYDSKVVFGCYKTARLIVADLDRIMGLPYDRHGLERDEALDEYKDAAEIDSISMGNEGTKLMIDAGAVRQSDSFRLEAEGRSIDLVFERF